MRKAGILVLILVCFFSCVDKHKQHQECDLEGEWVFVWDKGRIAFNYFGLEFNKGIFYRVGDHGRILVGKYLINGDSLRIDDDGKRVVYPLIKCAGDSLIYMDEEVTMRFYNRALDYNDTLVLDSISFHAGTCEVGCPVFDFTIDMHKRLGTFIGGENAKVKGPKNIQLDDAQWQTLDSLFKWSNITRADTIVNYGATDDWSMRMDLMYNSGSSKSIKGTESRLYYGVKPISAELLKKLKMEGLI